jgi:hypothetical protein
MHSVSSIDTVWPRLLPRPEASESICHLAHWGVFSALFLNFGCAGTPLRLIDRIHDHGDVIAAAPPGGLFYIYGQ